MGTYDQAGIQHASALHWATTIGKQRWVGPGKFWVYEPTYIGQTGTDIPSRDVCSRAIYDGDVIKGLKLAETFFMDQEIARWLVRSSMGRPPMRMERHLLPSEAGYLWFDQHTPITGRLTYKDDSPLALAALQWSIDPSLVPEGPEDGTGRPSWHRGDTLRLVPWVHIDAEGARGPILVRYGGVPIGAISWKLGMQDLIATEVDEYGTPVGLAEVGDGTDGSGIRIDAMLDARMIPPGEPMAVRYIGREAEYSHGAMLDILGRCIEVFGTILLFMSQRLIVSSRERPSRNSAKQMERSDLIVRDIVTVKLRKQVYLRKEGGEGEHREIDWQWRWPVTGHWRKPRKDGVGPRRPIFIPTYWKGPEGRPLKPANEKLFAIVR